ncbi:hypothetical protein NE865_11371 [Phthorimaea operculella]|nr:hypothetical protein NE865_11371 [Phthorimaea operculella]
MFLILLSSLVLIANGHPVQENEDPVPTTTEYAADSIPPEIQQSVNLVAYIENFKNAMTDYVTSQYQNLTIDETEQVKTVIEEFLTNFAKDLREAVENQARNVTVTEHEEIQDGVPEETFKAIGERVREEFPEVTEATAKEIVYRLRRNLLETRNRLDAIIRHSQRALAEIEVDN